jgi:pyruvate dehydrogenase kinase 2/3/4
MRLSARRVRAAEVQVNFVPNHLHHIIFELMKNSMRAVLEHHGVQNYDAPAIQVVLTDDEREFAIKISDQGGGIPRKDMHRIWSYLYSTTSAKSAKELLEGINGGGGGGGSGPVVDAAAGHPTNAVGPEGDGAGPMSGFGYGLPLARLYSCYFGGDLNVVSVEGYGTDAYLYLTKLNNVSLFLE